MRKANESVGNKQSSIALVSVTGVLFLLFIIFSSGCDLAASVATIVLTQPDQHELVGNWEGPDDSITFYADGRVKLSGNVIPDSAIITWDTVDVEDPKQLYVTIEAEGKRGRSMLGIYKIVDEKLYIRAPTEYYKTIGGFRVGGPTRVDYPTDFSGDVNVYKRSQ